MYILKKAICLLLFTITISFAEVITYTPAAEVKSSEWFQVSTENKSVFVYDSPVAPFTIFDFKGEITLNIKSKKDIRWLDIRPRSLGLVYSYTGNSITIKINRPCQFSIEINQMPYQEPLLVFANPLEKSKPNPKDTNVIFYETGKVHKIGKIQLRNNKTLYIEGGAIVEGHILAENASNIKIMGSGLLNGINNKEYQKDKRWGKFIELIDCSNITLSGITLINAVTWEVVPTHCNNMLIDNLHILSENGGDDGIDIVRTKNLVIQNSFIRTKDDNIVVKCIRKYPDTETSENILVRNCVLWNTVWGNAIEIGFELAATEVKNIRFQDCDIIHCEAGAAISIHNTDYAIIKDLVFEDIRIEETTQKLFDLSIFLSKYSTDNTFSKEETAARYWHGVWDNAILLTDEEKIKFSAKRGSIENILFKNISVIDGPPNSFSVIAGYDKQHMIRNITFDNVTIYGKKMTNLVNGKFVVEHVENIVFK